MAKREHRSSDRDEIVTDDGQAGVDQDGLRGPASESTHSPRHLVVNIKASTGEVEIMEQPADVVGMETPDVSGVGVEAESAAIDGNVAVEDSVVDASKVAVEVVGDVSDDASLDGESEGDSPVRHGDFSPVASEVSVEAAEMVDAVQCESERVDAGAVSNVAGTHFADGVVSVSDDDPDMSMDGDVEDASVSDSAVVESAADLSASDAAVGPAVHEGGMSDLGTQQDVVPSTDSDGVSTDDGSRKGFHLIPKSVSLVACGLIAAGALAVGLGLGSSFLVPSRTSQPVSVVAADSENMGDVICHVSWNGHEADLSVEDVLLANGVMLSQRNAGTYDIPSAETILAVGRARVLAMAAEEAGISVTDDDIRSYVTDTLNVPDFKAAVDAYHLSEEELVRLARNSVITGRLREHVLAEAGVTESEPPAAPEAPDKGAERKPSRVYYDYIVSLVGDDGVSESGEITNEAYAEALKGMNVNAKKGATFDAAQAAYDVALKEYASATRPDDVWSDYRKDILKDAVVEVRTLMW